MATFKGRIKIGYENIEYVKTGASVDYLNPTDRSAPLFMRDLTSGVLANQADIFYRQEVSIVTAGNFILDLNGPSIQDIFGTNLAMLSLVNVLVINGPVDESSAPNTTTVTLTTTIPGIISGTSPSIPLTPGTAFSKSNTGTGGLGAITSGTADIITLTNAAGATAKVQICVIGRSV